MLKDHEIDICYQAVLGRRPESSQRVEACKAKFQTIEALRLMLLNSEEFEGISKVLKAPVFDSIARRDSSGSSCLVFMHIPKCAGTTLHNALIGNFSRSLICEERHNGLANFSRNSLLKYQFFSGHFDYQSIIDLPHENKNIVTILRDPYDRLVSLYNFLRSHKLDFAEKNHMELVRFSHKYNIYDFFSLPEIRMHHSIHNAYVRALTTNLPLIRWESYGIDVIKYVPDERTLLENDSLALALSRLDKMKVITMSGDFNNKLSTLLSDLSFSSIEKLEIKQVSNEIMIINSNLRKIEQSRLDDKLRVILNPLVQIDLHIYEQVNAKVNMRS
ncbi:sulfotransferase family 2 domain-containing protein [uncultured Paraglaciecola sp.]|uniref:sulfotransferase family 2 domain-containing protein n=1 Tax=uncultured Paraglaciecola sp. TaxID=1765024 RepID=UPI0030DA2E4C|tara:strand:- start:3606 stop:4598 length:993 start_codon:yes stop_codon:yes gene_type:complete